MNQGGLEPLGCIEIGTNGLVGLIFFLQGWSHLRDSLAHIRLLCTDTDSGRTWLVKIQTTTPRWVCISIGRLALEGLPILIHIPRSTVHFKVFEG